ncbi:MAG: ABC-2 family transporter protein [bacterium]
MLESSAFGKLENYATDMRIILRASLVYFSQCLQAVLLYRSALVIFIVSEGFAYAGFITFWYKAAQSNPAQQIYSPLNLVYYFALSMFHHSIQHHTASRDLGSDIRLGKLSYSIIRPFPFLLQATLRSVACTLVYIILLLPLLLLGLYFTPSLWQQFSASISSPAFSNFGLALILALLCGWFIRLVVGMLAFNMAQIWGPDTFFIALYYAASGAVYPIDLLPTWALTLVKWTPMYYMVGFPVLTLMGRIPPQDFYAECWRGTMVLTALLVIMFLMWRRGLRKFEAIGI